MEPITTELRKLMTHTVDGFDLNRPLVECDRAEFERLCDQIDAVHESLERENDSLRIELARTIGELDEMHKSDEISNKTTTFMHSGMSITHELREWISSVTWLNDGIHHTCDKITAIADRIDAEHERKVADARNDALYNANEKDMAELGWIRLPKDANGEYIHIGDVMEFTYDPPQDQPMFEVSGFGANGTLFYAPRGEVDPRKTTNASVVRHHHAPTVEDVLREFYTLAVRGKAAYAEDVDNAVLAEYASKLQLRED